MVQDSFYSKEELKTIGFKTIGENVLISRYARFYGVENISVGDNVRIDDFCILSGNISIGSYVHIASFVALYGQCNITIEDFAGISARTCIYTANDNYFGESLTGPTIPIKYRKLETGMVLIKKHAIIGNGCIILPNSTISTGSAIGALSLVKGIIDEWGIYSGIPAVFRKPRRSDIIPKLENDLLSLNR
jgi:acetyltransferase-like isoleucine patch superfamily enzyme